MGHSFQGPNDPLEAKTRISNTLLPEYEWSYICWRCSAKDRRLGQRKSRGIGNMTMKPGCEGNKLQRDAVVFLTRDGAATAEDC